jgi:IS5 family transposase
MARTAPSQISFADWEFVQQKISLEPMLQAISDFMDGQARLVEKVQRDLQRGLRHPDTGRNGLSPAQVLRSLILMRVKNWHYRELRERTADGYTLRQFTDFYSRPVPKHGNLVVLEGQETVVGDGHPMGETREITEHRMGTIEGWLGIDDPL